MRGIVLLGLLALGCGTDGAGSPPLCEPPPMECPAEQYAIVWDCNPDDEDLDGDGFDGDWDLRITGRELAEPHCIVEYEVCHPAGTDFDPGALDRDYSEYRSWGLLTRGGGEAVLERFYSLEDDGRYHQTRCCRGLPFIETIQLVDYSVPFNSVAETVAEYDCPPLSIGVGPISLPPGELPPVAPRYEGQ